MAKYIKMSTRYSEVIGDDVQDHHLTVFEDSDPTPTGVLDRDGNEFFRVKETVPMGFHRGRDQ